MSPTSIILFCYAYIVGIVLAMVSPADPRLLALLRMVTALAFAAAAAWLGWRAWNRRRLREAGGAPAWRWWDALVLVVPALCLGYTRYISSDTVLETRVGIVRMVQGVPVYRQDAPLADACRLRLRKVSPLKGDLALRLHGRLDARVAVTDTNGVALMDGEGRWRFRLARLAQQSEVVTVREDDPVGTDYLVEQPFSRVDRVEVVRGPEEGVLALYRVPNHMGSFAREGGRASSVTILGHIAQDPWVYDFKNVLHVAPDFVQYPPGGPFYKVEGGNVQVVLKPGLGNYREFSRTDAYGWDIQVQGELSSARSAANPGGFDPRRFMRNNNTYGVVSVFQPPGAASPIRVVAPEGRAPRRGNGLVEFSLDLRDRMLGIIKFTMPYPQSSFLGAVTLGLRYGLQGTLCMLSGQQKAGRPAPAETAEDGSLVPRGTCEELIAEEFKRSGVNHVLAVSGLHVTIITVMFVGIFVLLRIPRQVFTPLIILALVIFAIITGARPSVLRAVIMNGLFLLTWAYLGTGLRASALVGVPVAAFLILLQNPLVIVDPSFTLSFGAILSLALMTGPFYEPLCRLKGNDFLAFLLIAAGTTLIGVWHWALLVTPGFMLLLAAFWGLLAWGLHVLQRRGVRLIGGLGYENIPAGAGAFFAAQFAIQVGMMVPLSSYYFSRWPFAGAYANLVAIPLIGVVVQLGAIAGLLGMIPVVGPYIALVLNAANWVFSSAFLWLAHASAAAFPYPFTRRPSVSFLVVYYVFCAALIWRKPAWTWLRAQFARRGIEGWKPPAALAAALAVAVASPLWWPRKDTRPPGLNVTVLSVGYASSMLVETPAGRRILVDAGNVEHERGRRNDAIRTILPYLCHRGIRRLDAVILTSARPERTAGAAYVLDHAWADRLYVPPSLAGLTPEVPFEDFVRRIAPGGAADQYSSAFLHTAYDEIVRNPSWPKRPSLSRSLAARGPTFWNRWAGWAVDVKPVAAGDVLFEEQGERGAFRIEVLGPPADVGPDRPVENGSLVLRIVYGRFAMLVTSDLHYGGQRRLAERPAHELYADVMMVPHRGTAVPPGRPSEFKENVKAALESSLAPLLDKVKPSWALFEYGNPRGVLGLASRDGENAYELTRQYLEARLGTDACLDTGRDMAIFVRSDGGTYSVTTQAESQRAAGTDEGASDVFGGW